MLGEFALPRLEPVWTATILSALERLDIEQRASRQSLARTSAEGLLSSARHGRRTTWTLTDKGRALLEEGTTRIYGFMRKRRSWDGRWLVLSVSVPESQRQLRHRLRTQLTWLGLGSPASGLWVSPDATKADDVRRVVTELALDGQSFSWVGTAAEIGEETRLVDAAWDLDDVEKRYLVFLDEFDDRRAANAQEAFVNQVQLVQAWRRFPFLDPDLPRELLDHDWPGPRAASVFHDRHEQWHRHAQAEWDRMQTEASGRI